MLNPRISFYALLLAAAPMVAHAQDSTPQPADAATAAGLNMGVDLNQAPAEPKVGDIYSAAKFDDWEQRCEKTESGSDPCQLYQLLKDDQGNAVAEFSIFSLPEGGQGPAVAGATVIAPLETLLTEGMRLTVDSNATRGYPFNVCSQMGCIARIGFTAEDVGLFKKGAAATMGITPFIAPDQKVDLKISLKGFTAGYDAVTAANKAANEANKAAQ